MELLQGNRFAVASYGVAAGYAGWLLRQFGADVVHVSALDPEGVGAFLAEGASFAPAPSLDAEPGVTLITDAPVTPRNRQALEARAAGGGRVIWITPWGLDTPWTGRPASDLVLHAAGGWMCSVGDPGREPLGPPGAQGQFVGGLFAAIAALSGAAGGIIDLPLVEAVAATMIYDSVAFQYFGLIRGRVGNRFARSQPTLVTLPCKDGHIGIHAALHGQWVTLTKLIGHPELVSDPRFASPADRSANIAGLDSYLLPWLAERTRFEVFHTLQAARIPCAALPTLDEVLASPQLDARKAWRTVQTPSGRAYTVPGAPARVLAETGG
ncbi:MAG: CoA transferase, partial [Hyphomicrobiales bacterium]